MVAMRSHHHGQGDLTCPATGTLPTEAESRAYLATIDQSYAQWLQTRDSSASNITVLDTPKSTHSEPTGYGSAAITFPVYTIFNLPKPQVLNLRNGRTGTIHRKVDGGYRVYVGSIDLGYMKFQTIETYTVQQLRALNPGVAL